MAANTHNVTRNHELQCPIKNSNFQDVNVISFNIQKNNRASLSRGIQNESVSNTNFPFFTIRYILKGHLQAVVSGEKIHLPQDTLFVSFPNDGSLLIKDKNSPYTMAWFVCSGGKVKEILQHAGITEINSALHLQPNNSLRNLFAKTPSRCRNDITNSDIIALSAFYNIFELILEQTCTQGTPQAKYQAHVNTAIQYISDNYNNPELSALSVSRAICVSPKYLSRIFKQQTGTTLGHYIISQRLAAAIELMQKGNYSLTQIASICGFSSLYYFSAVYKKINKIPPSTTLQKYKDDNR